MTRFRQFRGALLAILLIVANGSQAQSYWNLGAAPSELAAYGYAYGILILDDQTATYYLAEYNPNPTGPNPPEIAIVAFHKGDADEAFIAVEAAAATDANGATVPGRRLAGAETERFNSNIFPALAAAHPQLAGAIRLSHFIYASERHFQPTRFFRERQEMARTTHEEPLLELLWQRDSANQSFSLHPSLLKAIPAAYLYITIAEATREREPLVLAASVPSTPPAAVSGTAVSPALASSTFDDPYFEASYCALTADLFRDAELKRGWDEVAERRSAGMPLDRMFELNDFALDLVPLTTNAEEDRAEYQQCRTRLASARAEVDRDAALAASARAEEETRRRAALNPHAPAKVDPLDISYTLIALQEPAERERLTTELRAWSAYCLVAGASLQAMTSANPAAFGLDPVQENHAKLLEQIQDTRNFLESQFASRFSAEEQTLARNFLEQQQDNYGLGFRERNNERDVVDFVKEQVFQCNDGLATLWRVMAAPTWESPPPVPSVWDQDIWGDRWKVLDEE